MYSGTKLSKPVTINGRTYPGGGNTPVVTLSGVKKTLECQLEALNFELQATRGTPAYRDLQLQKQYVLTQLEEIETQELQAAGVLPLPRAGSEEIDHANKFLGDVFDEYLSATEKYGGFNSAHEAYGVLLEEVEEFWDEVKLKRNLRNTDNMRKELVQIAAMALKAAVTIL